MLELVFRVCFICAFKCNLILFRPINGFLKITDADEEFINFEKDFSLLKALFLKFWSFSDFYSVGLAFSFLLLLFLAFWCRWSRVFCVPRWTYIECSETASSSGRVSRLSDRHLVGPVSLLGCIGRWLVGSWMQYQWLFIVWQRSVSVWWILKFSSSAIWFQIPEFEFIINLTLYCSCSVLFH